MRVVEATDNWTYTTATYRQANNSAANQLDFVIGIAEDDVTCGVCASGQNSGGNVQIQAGIGLDATNALATGVVNGVVNTTGTNINMVVRANYNGIPGIGRHYLAWLEYSSASGTTTWQGDNGSPTVTQNGIHGSVLA
jgi:hypothetical protein